jgi:hypothetical protein
MIRAIDWHYTGADAVIVIRTNRAPIELTIGAEHSRDLLQLITALRYGLAVLHSQDADTTIGQIVRGELDKMLDTTIKGDAK